VRTCLHLRTQGQGIVDERVQLAHFLGLDKEEVFVPWTPEASLKDTATHDPRHAGAGGAVHVNGCKRYSAASSR
jgi:hypothetical protein